MESLLGDIRYAARNLLKRPGFTAIAVITLALGIGANSAIFSPINAMLIKPLPFPDQDRVVAIWDRLPSRGIEHNEVAMANYLDWRAQNHSFQQLALYRWWSTNLTGRFTGAQGFLVTANFLDVHSASDRSWAAVLMRKKISPAKNAVAFYHSGSGNDVSAAIPASSTRRS